MAGWRTTKDIRLRNHGERTMSVCHFLYCPFTGLGSNEGYRGDAWLKNRIAIFKRFVLPSLMAQTKREFILWVSWRPQEKNNPIVKEFKRSLDGLRGLTTVFTYSGLCFWDDKYPEQVASERLKRALSMTLPQLAGFVSDAEWVYLTIQPSDDIYATDVVEKLQSVPPGRKALGFHHGYVMNYATKEVAEYNPTTLSPFTTIIFPRETFLDPKEHYQYTGPYSSHEYVFSHVQGEYLDGRKYLVGTHGENISTTWNIPYKGREILGSEKEKIWLEFACWDADPIVIHRRMRLVLRMLINLFPRPIQTILKTTYHVIRKIYYVIH